jgi:hypothetical protein
MISKDGNTCVVYEVSGVIRVISNRPRLAASNPGTINGLGPTFGSKVDAIPAKTMIPAVNGRNAKPDFSGLYPRIT